MLTRIQTRAFRCLKRADQSLREFNVLVGPNASGKTTFLDVINFLGDLVKNRGDVVKAVQDRSSNFEKLLWLGQGNAFDLAVEAEIPTTVRQKMSEEKRKFTHARYEIEVGIQENEIGLNHETLLLIEKPTHIGETETPSSPQQRALFPEIQASIDSILLRNGPGRTIAISKKPGGNDNYYPQGRNSYKPSHKLGRKEAALARVPADEDAFPVSLWFLRHLESIDTFILNSQVIRQPSPPGLGMRFKTDGSNLPWVISGLREKEPKKFQQWVEHVRTALPDVKDIDTIERPEDKHRYLTIRYDNDAVVPSWLVSDGTLRLLALTIPAYLPGLGGIFMIEEPENGIHPQAMETVFQSLSSMYGSQVLIATHSPVAINMLEPQNILCFAKDANGATDIVSGDNHPALLKWRKGEPDLGSLFASGILS
jgi:predicted ATPase